MKKILFYAIATTAMLFTSGCPEPQTGVMNDDSAGSDTPTDDPVVERDLKAEVETAKTNAMETEEDNHAIRTNTFRLKNTLGIKDDDTKAAPAKK